MVGATSAARKHKTEMAAKKRAHLETKRELEVRAKFREKEARANKRKQQLVSQKAAQGKYYNITSIIFVTHSFPLNLSLPVSINTSMSDHALFQYFFLFRLVLFFHHSFLSKSF